MDRGIVELVVKYRSPPIFDGVFYGGDGKNDDKRSCVECGIRSTKDGEDLCEIDVSLKSKKKKLAGGKAYA